MASHRRKPQSPMFRQFRNLLPPRAYVANEHTLTVARALMGLEAFEEYLDHVLLHLEGPQRDALWLKLCEDLQECLDVYHQAEHEAAMAAFDA